MTQLGGALGSGEEDSMRGRRKTLDGEDNTTKELAAAEKEREKR